MLTIPFEVTAAEADRNPANNTVHVSTTIVAGMVVYDSDFGAGDEWNLQATTTSPCGEGYLGEFGNETVTLSLADLPVHTRVQVSFDLYVLRSWDGNVVDWPPEMDAYSGISPNSVIGPDIWDLAIDGENRLHTTFSNWDDPVFRQSYPGTYPAGNYPSFTRASQVNSLCYAFWEYGPMDAVYRMNFEQIHTGSSLRIDFSASGLQGLVDESWGLDNVRVTLTGGGDLLPYKMYIPLIR